MTTPPLEGSAARHLRALGHDLAPVVAIGKDGLTDGIVDAAKAALLTHELIKVKVHPEAPLDRREAATELAARTDSALAQVLGRTFLLYKRHPKKPKIVLPRAPGAGVVVAPSGPHVAAAGVEMGQVRGCVAAGQVRVRIAATATATGDGSQPVSGRRRCRRACRRRRGTLRARHSGMMDH